MIALVLDGLESVLHGQCSQSCLLFALDLLIAMSTALIFVRLNQLPLSVQNIQCLDFDISLIISLALNEIW